MSNLEMDTVQLTSAPSAIIIHQPAQINNVFAVAPGENIVQTYECDQRVCGCGPVYTVTLTDARIIQRFQDYLCCCKGDYADSMLFLSDISSINNRGRGVNCRPCSFSCSLCFLILFFPCELLCCCWQCCFSDDIPIPISFVGPFGKEDFIFSQRTVLAALAEIPAAALPHKVSNRPSV